MGSAERADTERSCLNCARQGEDECLTYANRVCRYRSSMNDPCSDHVFDTAEGIKGRMEADLLILQGKCTHEKSSLYGGSIVSGHESSRQFRVCDRCGKTLGVVFPASATVVTVDLNKDKR